VRIVAVLALTVGVIPPLIVCLTLWSIGKH
jgi:hypothetical protein